jgi:ABC-type transport system substrate-binding protein
MDSNKKIKKLFSLRVWFQFFKILTKREKICFFVFLFFLISSFIFLLRSFYFKITKIVPAKGGEYIEGVLALSPVSLKDFNPVYSVSSDIGRDLTELIFSGLFKYNLKGEIVPDLVKEYKILEDGKVYEIYLKENVFWQDGTPLKADDVVFTVETIKNPEINSPLRSMWLGVEVEKVSDSMVRFKLKEGSGIFLENLTLKIIPKHLWENITPQNFPLTPLNLNTIGSGPYKLTNVSQDEKGKITSITLEENSLYFGPKPYIPKVSFIFFNSKEELIDFSKRKKITGFSLPDVKELKVPHGFLVYSFSLPRYFAVFFNLKNSKVLAEKDVRLALNYATNKEEILEKVFSNYGQIVNSPILPGFYHFKEPEKNYCFDLERAKEILEKASFVDEDGDGVLEKTIKKELAFQFKSNLSLGSKGKEVEELQKCLAKDKEIYPEGLVSGYFGESTQEAVRKFQEKYKEDILEPAGLEKGNGKVREKTREKLNEICFEKPEEKIPFKFSLATVNQPILIEVAKLLKNQWEKLGAKIDLKIFEFSDIESSVLRKKEYDAILFGEILGILPDPLPFWHSSQKGELGLNLSNYENKKVDEILEKARKLLDEKERKEKLEEFQEILLDDAPAIFLYNLEYQYFVSKEVKGIKGGLIVDPSKKFVEINNWYIKEKRILK